MILLTHPVHGQKHAYIEAEAVADEKNGWSRGEPAQPAVSAAPVITAASIERGALSILYVEKFGKKPHHRMSAETIAEKLK